jgi:hypothetical protein
MTQKNQAPAVVAARARDQQSPPSRSNCPVLTPPTPPRKGTNRPTVEDQILDALRQRIRACGMTLLEVDHRVGIADGYSGKLLRRHRRAKWATLQAVFDTLWPSGCQITISDLSQRGGQR